jgi:hypothetical protein
MGYLTGPVNTLTDYQVEFNGFLMGTPTAYEIPQGGHDFLDLAAVKTMETPRIWADGSFAGPDFSDVPLPQLTVEVGGANLAGFQANVAALRSAFTIQTGDLPLWFKMPGMPAMGMPVRVHKRSIPADWGWNGGLITCAFQFRGPSSPGWQSVPRTVSLSSSGAAVSGLVFPMFNVASGTYAVPGVADYGSTVVAGSSGTLTNAGNTVAWPVVTVPGPSAGFTVSLDGNQVTYSGGLQAGDVLVVDYATGLATLNGQVDRTYLLTSRMFSPVVALGTSTVFFTAASGTCQVTTADIWR